MRRALLREAIGYLPVTPPFPGRQIQEAPMAETENNKQTAQSLMAVHGLCAQAVVRERMAEARLRGDATDLSRWQNVEAAIGELRRTNPSGA